MQLLIREDVNLDAHGLEFEAGDLIVNIGWDGVNLLLQLICILRHVFG